MKLFTLTNSKLSGIPTLPFKLEKEIQTIVENNLKELFELEFVRSELRIKNFRFDTLGYDNQNRSFVIIEYKRDTNYSVIDQGYTYLSLMLNNKSDFILEYNETKNKNLKRDDVDWSQSRVIFISPHFTEFQKQSINFKDIPFEIWEIKRYANGLIGFSQHKTSSDESVSTIESIENNEVKKVSREVKVYTEDFLFESRKTSDEIKELYYSLKDRIMSLGEINVVPRLSYIGFKRKTNFVDVDFQKNNLWLWLNLKKGDLDDPKGLTGDVSGKGHYGNGDYELRIYPDTDLDYVMFLIKQSFKKQE
jgi:predicted transport protein